MKNSLKAILVVAMTVILIVSCIGTANKVEAAQTFSDVKTTAAYYEAADYAVTVGAIQIKSGKFNPNAEVTRGQYAKMLAVALKLNTKKVTNSNLKDVTTKNTYYPYIAAVVKAGIMPVDKKTKTFGVNTKITRGEVAKYTAIGYKVKLRKGDAKDFTDLKSSSDIGKYVAAYQFYNADFAKVALSNVTASQVKKDQFAATAKAKQSDVAVFLYEANNANAWNKKVTAIAAEKLGTIKSIKNFKTTAGTKNQFKYDSLNKQLIIIPVEEEKSFIYWNQKTENKLMYTVDKNLKVTYEIAAKVKNEYKGVVKVEIDNKRYWDTTANQELRGTLVSATITDMSTGEKKSFSGPTAKNLTLSSYINETALKVEASYESGNIQPVVHYVIDTDSMFDVYAALARKGDSSSIFFGFEYIWDNTPEVSATVVQGVENSYTVEDNYDSNIENNYMRGIRFTEPGLYRVTSGKSKKIFKVIKINNEFYAYPYSHTNKDVEFTF